MLNKFLLNADDCFFIPHKQNSLNVEDFKFSDDRNSNSEFIKQQLI